MPAIDVRLDKEFYHLGDEARISIVAYRDIAFFDFVIVFNLVALHNVSHNFTKSYITKKGPVYNLKSILKKFNLKKGERIDYVLKLPKEIPYSYSPSNTYISYYLDVILKTPWLRYDIIVRKYITILPIPKIPEISLHQIDITAKNDPDYILLQYASNDFYPESLIPLMINVSTDNSFRDVRIELIYEYTIGIFNPKKGVRKIKYSIPNTYIKSNQPSIVFLNIPNIKNAFSINSEYFRLNWYLKVTLNRPFKKDLTKKIPIRMILPTTDISMRLFNLIRSNIDNYANIIYVDSSGGVKTYSDISEFIDQNCINPSEILQKLGLTPVSSYESESSVQESNKNLDLLHAFKSLRYLGELKFEPDENNFTHVTLKPQNDMLHFINYNISTNGLHVVAAGKTKLKSNISVNISGDLTNNSDDIYYELLSKVKITSDNSSFKSILRKSISLGYSIAELKGPFSLQLNTLSKTFEIKLDVLPFQQNVKSAVHVINALVSTLKTILD